MQLPWVEIAPGTQLVAGDFLVPDFSDTPLPLVTNLVFTATYEADPLATDPQPMFRVVFSDDGVTPIYDTDAIGPAVSSGGVYAVRTIGIGLVMGLVPTGGFPASYDIPVSNPGGHRYMRIEPAEVGDPAHPGKIGIVVRGVS